MSAAPRVSVVVVSHHRPEALLRCLTSLAQLDYPEAEIVVVADGAGLEAAQGAGWGGRVKSVQSQGPGISAARNAGLALAAGEVVAFIDDDAVAEASWLRHLAQPFADPHVAAAGGYVRGRNGISFQWTARSVDRTGAHMPLDVTGTGASLHRATPARAIRTEGTNMAFRRETLAGIGGFDPAYRFFLDETDVNMRLAERGAVTAIVPLAQVHHGFAASSRRTRERAPRDLTDIGASTAVFLRKFAPEGETETNLNRLRDDQRRRVLAHMVAGRLGPDEVAPLLEGLENGIAEGLARALLPLRPVESTGAPFLPLDTARCTGVMLAGRPWQAGRLRARAAALAKGGQPTTLFLFSPTAIFHRMRFRSAGYWEQSGGLFGKSERTDPHFRVGSFAGRLRREVARLAPVRPLVPAERAGGAQRGEKNA